MKIHISNCNNVKDAILSIPKGKKTLVLGNNGTGKTTITKAIVNHINSEDLSELKSFNIKIQGEPAVSIENSLTNVMNFDENYSSEFVFGEKEILENSNTYNLMQIDDVARQNISEVTELLRTFKKTVKEAVLPKTKIIDDVQKIRNNSTNTFKLSKKFEGLVKENPLLDDAIVKDFKPIINHVKSPVAWNKWRKTYSIQEKLCPYCSQSISDELEETIILLNNTLDDHSVTSREALLKIKNELKDSLGTNLEIFDNIIDDTEPLDEESSQKKLIQTIDKLTNMKETLKQIVHLAEDNIYENPIKLEDIEINDLEELSSFSSIKNEFDILVEKNTQLKKLTGKINSRFRRALSSNVDILNKFCKETNIPYKFKNENEKILMHFEGSDTVVSNPKERLSFGEKNALATMFFALIAKHQDTELIILDDPFSSFDEHKRFFLHQHLFGKNGLLNNKTILYLTHDVEPVYDLIYLGKPTYFDNCFGLKNNVGKIESHIILKKDINTYKNHLLRVLNETDVDIIQLISIRKLLEITGRHIDDGSSENNYLSYQYISSYTKGGPMRFKKGSKYELMSEEEEQESLENLKEFCKDQNIRLLPLDSTEITFQEALNKYRNLDLANEKLIYIRYLINRYDNEIGQYRDSNKALKDYFLNLVNHFEKERMLVINPKMYSPLPQYVSELADQQFEFLSNSIL